MKFQLSHILIFFIVLDLLVVLTLDGSASEKQLVLTSDMQYGYAEKLFSQKDYETAMVEFKRFNHFFPGSPQNDQARFKIGVCLFNLKKFYDAAGIFNEIIINDKENDMTKESNFLQSKAFMNMGNTGYAQIVLQNYLKLVKDRETKDRIFFNLAQIHLEDARKGRSASLDLARDNLSKISLAGAQKYNTDQYLSLILEAELSPKKNPEFAGLFAIIPGGGFLYCGRYHDALITFLLNAGLMVATYKAYDNDNAALAAVIGLVETGFYTGNIYGSISSAHKYNRAQVFNVLNKAFSITSKLDPEKKSYELSFDYGF